MGDNLNNRKDDQDESSREDTVQSYEVEKDNRFYSHVVEGILQLLDEPEDSSVCIGQEVKKQDKNGWINTCLAEGSTISEDKNSIPEFPQERVSNAGSEIAESGNVTCGYPDINKLDYSSYADVLWEIVCKNCFFVSESWGLENHKCERNEDENVSTEKLIVCEKCGLSLSNNETFEEHESSRKHILLILNKKGDDYIEELCIYYCYLCKVQSMTHKSYYNHITGEQHTSLLTDLNFQCDSYCIMCKFTMDKTGRDIHLFSKTHLVQSVLKENKFNALFNRESLAGKSICEVCDFNCGKKKNYLDHLASIEHTINEVNLLIANMDFIIFQYISALPEGYKCLPCDITISSEYLLKIHCNIDDHIYNVQKYEKQIEMLPTVITEDQTQITKRPLDIIGTTTRYIAHIYKDFEEYLEWKMIVVTDNYCYLCETDKKEFHAKSKLHVEKSKRLFYCVVCDKTYDLKDKELHLKLSSHHKKMLLQHGNEGKPNKLGIKNPTWKCTVCKMSFPNNDNEKKYHLDSKAHRENFDEYLNSHWLKYAITYVNL